MTSLLPKIRSAWESPRVRGIIQAGAVALVCLLSFCYALYGAETVGKYSESYSPDAANYIATAKRLITDHTYSFWGKGPDAYVPPGYPLFLAAGMAVFGMDVRGLFCVKAVQCLLAAGTVCLTFVLGRLLTGRYSVGMAACLLVALNGSFYLYCRLMLTENLYFFTMMLFFVLAAAALRRDRLWLHVAAGAALGITVMVRPLVVVAAPFVYLPLIIERWGQVRRILPPLACFAGGFVAVCLPWWIRNAVTLHAFIPLATQTNPIYAGLAQDVDALGLKDPGTFGGNLLLLFQLLREHFFSTVYWMTLGKFQVIFMGEVSDGRFVAFTTLVRDLTLYLGLLGGVRALFRKKSWGPALAFWVYLASSFLFVPTPRYALQYMPLLAVLAGWLIMNTFAKEKEPV